MDRKRIIADYLTFTRGNRIAILVILFCLIGVFFLPDFLSKENDSLQVLSDTTWISKLKSLEQRAADNSSNTSYNNDNSANFQFDKKSNNYYSKAKGELFNFDPNTLSTEGWKRLGLRDKTISTIQNYLSKGGKFRIAEDLSRIYGLFPNEYERIAPYITIQSIESPSAIKKYEEFNKYPENQNSKTNSSDYSIIDINTADAGEFMSLPGIGPTFSTRIINFREKLGGFYSIQQIVETFGFPDSTFQKIKKYLKLENTAIRKININTATIDELKAHPYIRYQLANPIIAYRNQHGNFISLENLKKIMTITEELYIKISPYLTL